MYKHRIKLAFRLNWDCQIRQKFNSFFHISRCYNSNTGERCQTMDELLLHRSDQAKRTIIVQAMSHSSVNYISRICQEFGAINEVFCYNINSTPYKKYFLVEYKDVASVRSANQNAKTPTNTTRTNPAMFQELLTLHNYSNIFTVPGSDPNYLPTKAGTEPLHSVLSSCSNVSEQINQLYLRSKLTEQSIRLRFITCHQVKQVLSGIYPDVQVLPFGSSINSFGTDDSDLDACIQFGEIKHLNDDDKGNHLIHQTEGSLIHKNDLRVSKQMILQCIALIIKTHIPYCNEIVKILKARIPILRYHQQIAGLNCDLSIQQRDGIYMSELLYIYSNADPRVPRLVFAIRHWCKMVNLNPSEDTQRISNFAITLMTLFYLMIIKPDPILLPVYRLNELARDTDRRVLSDGNQCNFLRDPSLLPPSENMQSLSELLIGFFEFYSSFNFKSSGICLISGNIIKKKKTDSCLLIKNPQSPRLNVTANVTLHHVEELKSKLNKAVKNKELLTDNTSILKRKQWGIQTLDQSSGSRKTTFDLPDLMNL